MKELNKTGVKYEVSKLNIGDFAWIARSKSNRGMQSTDIVLDYIVERKRVDDLCQSIIDGRYKEQKVIIKPCIQCSQNDHLISNYFKVSDQTKWHLQCYLHDRTVWLNEKFQFTRSLDQTGHYQHANNRRLFRQRNKRYSGFCQLSVTIHQKLNQLV